MVERAGRVENKVAIVTGAGSVPGPGVGTGKATSVLLAREGARVLLSDMHPERADETRQMIEEEGGEAVVFAGDMTRSADCEAMVAAAVDAFGTVDILVNNIGLPVVGSALDLSEEEFQHGMDVNLGTAYLASKAALPVMVEQGRGAIVNVSSVAGMRGNGALPYATGKGAMLAMTVDMAYSHGRQGVRVNAVVPGHIVTPMILSEYGGPGPGTDYRLALRRESGFLGTDGTSWDIANAILFLASDDAKWITGHALPVDGGTLMGLPMVMAPYILGIPRPERPQAERP